MYNKVIDLFLMFELKILKIIIKSIDLNSTVELVFTEEHCT